MGIQTPIFAKNFFLYHTPFYAIEPSLAQTWRKATSSGNLKVAQNMRFFGATSLTS